MTVSSFKRKYPEHADLEGDALWDMMTLKMLDDSPSEEFKDFDRNLNKEYPKTPTESYRFVILDLSKKDEAI